jgi:hypothetical protein
MDVIAGQKHCICHRDEILASDMCGCFYCLAVFPPNEVTEWTDKTVGIGQTALCPKCGIDSVIGAIQSHQVSWPECENIGFASAAPACMTLNLAIERRAADHTA